MKIFLKKNKRSNTGFSRLVDLGDATSSRTKGASPKLSTGFSLIETLVALSIFTISTLALFSVISDGVANTNYAKRRTVASFLAQEGVEYMRNMRDTYVLYDAVSSQAGWDKFKNKLRTGECDESDGCYFDDSSLNYNSNLQPVTAIPVTACTSSCPPLLYDNTTGKYGYGSGGNWVNSSFTRRIKLAHNSDDELQITSTVTWSQLSGARTVEFSESLFNWVE